MEQTLNTEAPKRTTDTGNYSKGKCGKWTKEYAREYMRARYRRVYNVDPAMQKPTIEDKQDEEEKWIAKFGPEFKTYLEEQKAKKSKYNRKKVPRYTCDICGVEFADTEGRHRQHLLTKRHQIAQETLLLASSKN